MAQFLNVIGFHGPLKIYIYLNRAMQKANENASGLQTVRLMKVQVKVVIEVQL